MGHVTTRELRAAGMSERQIRSAVARGALIRMRIGHHARTDASETAMAAGRGTGRRRADGQRSRAGTPARVRMTGTRAARASAS
ncbi:type IV toxin-antitoxin system AbiEi family antitoxin domain-containing protein [Lysinimonas soli]|uniref:Type IV toxin-antitoxin system AbiEi family antitoxin domain-containing protein n=1 Tax=Lysinimonas soli TaxID=1074233 RepID=A0ABW0NUU6_9MICO